ncbi:MAG: ATP-binding protein [Candidatus Kapaibacterium sp.]
MKIFRAFGIKARLTLWCILMFSGGMVTILFVRSIIIVRGELARLDELGSDYANYLLSHEEAWTDDTATLFRAMDELCANSDLRFRSLWIFLSDDHHVLYDNSVRHVVPILLDSLYSRTPSLESGSYQTVAYHNQEYRLHARSTPLPYHLYVVLPLSDIQNILWKGQVFMFISLFILTIFVGGGCWLLLHNAFKPMKKSIQAAENISLTDLQLRLPPGENHDELSELTESLNRMIARLEKASDAQRRFITSMTHDLRTPLTILKFDLVQSVAEEEDPAVHKRIERSLRQVERLEVLTAELLAIAKLEAGALRPDLRTVQLKSLLLELMNDSRPRAEEKNITLSTTLPEDEVPCFADSLLLRRALNNIVENALIYSNEGGTIHLKMTATPATVLLSVTDDGLGMTRAEVKQATKRFWRGSSGKEKSGTGLGLSIVKDIVEAHGGSLEIVSEPEQGTTVTLKLPR